MRYAKFWTSVLMTVLAAVIPALAVGPMDAAAWANVVILAGGALSVVVAPNVPGFAFTKLIVAGISAVAVVLVSALTDGGIDLAEIVQMVVAFGSAVGVGVIPNSGAPSEPHVVQ